MADRFIVTSYRFKQHTTLAEAQDKANALRAKHPDKTFRIHRVKTHLNAGSWNELMRFVKGNLDETNEWDAVNKLRLIKDKIKEYENAAV